VTPTTELLAILDGVAAASLLDLAKTAAPPPLNARGVVDGRTRAGRQWAERQIELIEAGVGMIEAGLVDVVIEADGYNPCEVAITDAGRRYLGQMRALP
jgi:hypothetical protein